MISEKLEKTTELLWQESSKRINQLLMDYKDFNIADYYYLTAIHNMSNPNLGDVARDLGLTKPAISALIKRLQRHEFIVKVQSQEDKRVFYLNLTDRGKEIINGDATLYIQLEKRICAGMSADEVASLESLLENVYVSMQEAN